MVRRIFVLFLLVVITSAFAVPVSYQGKLTNTAGVGVNDTVNIAMLIYDAPTGGTIVDADTSVNVVVLHGLFSTIFDFDVPSSYIAGALYAEIQIDDGSGFTAISPRQQINAEFRAMWADNTVNAIFADTAYYAVAGSIFYDNTTSGLTATDVQAAIDELAAIPPGGSLQDAYDLGNTITGDNSVSITLNPGHGRALYAKVGKNGISASTAAAVYACNDSTGPAIYASGNIVQAAGKYIGTNGDTRILLDINNNSDDHFRVYNGDTNVVFDVNEYGFASVAGSLMVGNLPDDAVHDSLLTIDNGVIKKVASSDIGGASVNDSNFIQNQDTVAQPAKFWVANEGNFGVYMTATQNDIWTDDFEDGNISDWDTTQYLSGGAVWTITNPGARTASGGCSGTFLIVDDDNMGSGVTTSATAISPIVDLTPAGSNPVFLEFNQYYNNFSTDVCSLFVYDGTSWILLDEFTADTSGLVSYDISPYVNANFQVKFKYDDDANYAWYWMVDNLRIYYVTFSTPAPSIIADGPAGNLELKTSAGDVIFDGTGLKTSGGAGIVGYDNTMSGLLATNVQDAIDEIVGITDSGKDTLWTVAEDPADTMVLMAQTKIYGELITDSIQAVGDTVYFDDNISASCAKFGGGAVPIDTLLIEGFEGGTFPPTGWTQNYVVGTTDWIQSNADAHSGSNSAKFSYNTERHDRTELITPTMNLSTYGSAFLEFWHYQNAWSGDQDSLEVYYSDDGGTSWNLLIGYYNDIPSWTFASITLPSLSATYQIKFLGIEDYGYGVYLDDVLLYAPTGSAPPSVEICAGNISADGNLDIGGNATIGDTLEALHYRDSSGDYLLRSSDASVVISEDADGSWDLTVVGGGGSVPTLDQCYNSGSSGGGRSITADAGPVDINANGSTNGALNLSADDPSVATLYINHRAVPPGNGIWNDANYWSPAGNVSLGTGNFHTNSGLFESNADFIAKIDADNSSDDSLLVQNSVGTTVFYVDEDGNTGLGGDLRIVGGINDGVGTGTAGQVLTADGAGHFSWQVLPTGSGLWTDHATDPYIYANNNAYVQVYDTLEETYLKVINFGGTGAQTAIMGLGDYGANDTALGYLGYGGYPAGHPDSWGGAAVYGYTSYYIDAVYGYAEDGGYGVFGVVDGPDDYAGVRGYNVHSGTNGRIATQNYGGEFDHGIFLIPGTAPTDSEGVIYSDATTHSLYYYNGTSWIDLLSSPDNDWTRTGNYLYPRNVRGDTVIIGRNTALDNDHIFQVDSGAVIFNSNSINDLGYPGLTVNNQNGSASVTPITGSNTWGAFITATSDTSVQTIGVAGIAESGTTAIGVYGYAAFGDTNWAGYFEGDMRVTDSLELGTNDASAIGMNKRTDWEQLNVITVGMGNADFTNLEIAINVANGLPNAIIKIAPGAYNIANPIVVNSTVVLRGSGQQNTAVTGAPIDFNPNSEAYYIHFENDVNLSGIADGCWFTGNVKMSGGLAVARNCNFDAIGGTDTLGLVDGGRIEQCDFNMGIKGEGNWTISDCKFNVAANFHPPASGSTEVHIDGCDIFDAITLVGSGTFGYFESNRFKSGGTTTALDVNNSASAEIKANHFIDSNIGVYAQSGTDVTVQSNDFINCGSYGIYGLNADRLDIIGNNILGKGTTVNGIYIYSITSGIIKNNKITDCSVGIDIYNSNLLVDNNVVFGSTNDGLRIQNCTCQIFHNTLLGNGDGSTTFDLNDISTAPSSVASYNVVDTYAPSSSAAFGGAFNTNSAGTVYGGTQPGQLP